MRTRAFEFYLGTKQLQLTPWSCVRSFRSKSLLSRLLAEPRMKHFLFVRHYPVLMNLTFLVGVLLNAFLLTCKYVHDLVQRPRYFHHAALFESIM